MKKLKTKEEIEIWLNKYNIENYIINDNLTVNIKGNVNLAYKDLIYIPIQFNEVNGSFYCNHNKLISLEGCPKIIKGYFDCGFNKLNNLEYCPKEIKGSFICTNNNIRNLEFCPEKIGIDFYCNNNKELKEIQNITDFNLILQEQRRYLIIKEKENLENILGVKNITTKKLKI